MEIVLQAIYKGKVELCEDNIFDTVSASHHLQYQPLLDVCQNYLIDTIDHKNCTSYRYLAELHDMTFIVSYIDQYILDHFKEFRLTDGFLQLSKDDLSRYLQDDALIADEIEVFKGLQSWISHDESREEFRDEIANLLRYGLLDDDDVGNEMIETFPSLKTKIAADLCDDTDDSERETTNLMLKKGKAHCCRGYKTYAMLLRKRSHPSKYSHSGEDDSLVFLKEKETKGKTQFEGWHVTTPAPFLDNSVHSFVYNNYWFLFGIESEEYSYSFLCFDCRRQAWLMLDAPVSQTAVGTYGFLLGNKICIGAGSQVAEGLDNKSDKPYIIDDASVFNISTSEWSEISGRKPGIAFAACCEYKGDGYIVGGYQRREDIDDPDESAFQIDSPWDEYVISKSVFVYKPDTEEYIKKTPLNSARYHASVGVLGDHILVVGGLDGDSRGPEIAYELYSPQVDQWTYIRGDHRIFDAILIPTPNGFAVKKDEIYPLLYFEMDAKGNVNTYQKLSRQPVRWDPGRDHWADIERKVMTVAILTMLPQNTGWKYKAKETRIGLIPLKN